MTRARSIVAVLWCAACSWAYGQSWSPDDWWNWRTLSDPRISPDGRQAVYVEEWNDRATDAAYSNLWLVSTVDKQTRRLTEGAWRDRSPRWSPDGTRVAWISGRGGIHVLTLGSGEERAIESTPLTFAWARDGQSIAFTAYGKAPNASWAPAAILPYLMPRTHGDANLFVVPAAGGTPQAVAEGDAVGEPAWTRDGKSIVAAFSDGQIYAVRLADQDKRRLTDGANRNQSPVMSPDGAKIAWTSIEGGLHSYSVGKLHVMNADGSRVKPVAAALDRDPQNPQWSSDSRTIYFLADDAGSTHVYASRNDSTVRQVTQGVERLRGFSLADNGRAVAVRSTGKAIELVSFAVDMPPPTPVVLAAPMTKLMADRETAAAEEIHVASAGKSIQAWTIKPGKFESGGKYPLLLDIADDPRRMFGPDFSLRAQIFAARGWVVLRVDPRGTPGYGEEFGRLLATRYPGDDADDLLAAVEFVVAKGGIDEKRIAVSGGLLAAWLLGHSDRFAAVVARRPMVDFTSLGERAAPWMGALPWDNPDQYVKHSPIYFAGKWKTPTLVLAGEHDAQSEEFFAALQVRKVDSTMVRIPDRPSAKVLEVETALAWLGSVMGAR